MKSDLFVLWVKPNVATFNGFYGLNSNLNYISNCKQYIPFLENALDYSFLSNFSILNNINAFWPICILYMDLTISAYRQQYYLIKYRSDNIEICISICPPINTDQVLVQLDPIQFSNFAWNQLDILNVIRGIMIPSKKISL